MPEQLTWDNAEDVGILLSQTHPELAPLTVRLPDLQKLVAELPGFHDSSTKPADKELEAIRKAWHEEFQDRTQD